MFGRPIGKNQGERHPLVESWMRLGAARLMIYQAARLYDQGYTGGEYANVNDISWLMVAWGMKRSIMWSAISVKSLFRELLQ